ncbi:SDR family NAD(P)-dependent oxidoreductase [Actinokineospora bangkokensis]|uniref:Ketoreductase domain-containing protein n=1 Tax=Actinokineospora bangkokensis TaxID=1193682 RepID=A0A1Q9LKV8_9PSEU|nr:SDR family oxidoreductase [Actinokineospora bangkokensis]OLR92681.1 hypothetical protein BJP25_21900 [Actinokineospora bangkokensis]
MSRLIVITGASAGIGKATAHRFAANGDAVLMVGRRETALAAAGDELRAAVGGADVRHVALDMGEVDSVPALQDAVAATGLPVHGLLCCAGGTAGTGEGVKAVLSEWDEAYRTNVLTAVLATEGLVDQLADGASVVLYSSIAAYRGSGGTGAYGAAKAALHSYVHTLANRLGPRRITANAIAPGYVAETDFFDGAIDPDREAALVRQSVVGRAGVPGDVAGLAFYLCSPEAAYVTSQIIQVNGGQRHGV